MKITLTQNEANSFARNAAPILMLMDLEANKKMKEGDVKSNMALDMASDLDKYFSLGYEVVDHGPYVMSNVDGNLVIDFKSDMIVELVELYLKSTFELIKPFMTLIPLFKKQGEDMKALVEKWNPSKKEI